MSSRRADVRGFSVLELAVAVAIVGVAVASVLGVTASRTTSSELLQAKHGLASAKAALVSFAFIHSRLPCPAKTTKGKEACDGSTSGYLPFSTLGMVDDAAGGIRYELPSAALTAAGGGLAISVSAPVDNGPTAWPRYAAGSATLNTVVDAAHYDSKLDFCAALEQGPLDQPTATLTASDPSIGQAGREFVMSASISGQLGCAGLLATAARSHFSTALAAAAMSNSFADFKAQFDVAYDLYYWDLVTGAWSAADAHLSMGKGITKTFLAVSAWLESDMLNVKPMISLISLGATTATYARAVSNLARFSYNMAVAQQNRELFAQINDRLIEANDEIQANVRLDAAIGDVTGYQGMKKLDVPPPPTGAAYDGSNPLGQTAKDFIGALGGSAP